jgi:hypothetical protein
MWQRRSPPRHEVRFGAVGHVAAPKPTSVGRCGLKLQHMWQRVDARHAPCLDLELVCGGTRSSGCRHLLNKCYSNNDDCPCVFIYKSSIGFCIIPVYVDDLNIIGIELDINEARDHLKREFKMNDLGKTKFCLCLQLEHLTTGILIHQSTYVQKILEKFNMDKVYLSKTPMVVRALEIDTDPFWPRQEGEEVLGSKYPYLSVIRTLMYLANNTRPDIAFAVNLLKRYSVALTMRHWNGVKDVLRYLRGTSDLGLFYPKNQDMGLIGYADAGYLSDPHNSKSQICFMFLHGGVTISWKFCKQTLINTSTNHSEIIALYEAARECAWLRRVINYIQISCGIEPIGPPTIIYEDNVACIAQIQSGYVKSNVTKHIRPKLFYPHEIQVNGENSILQTKSCDNSTDLFTKSLAYCTFSKCVADIGMCELRDLQDLEEDLS